MCGCDRHDDYRAACNCTCAHSSRGECDSVHLEALNPGIYVVREGAMTVASDQIGAVGLAERIGSIERAALAAQFRAIADVIERHGPCDGTVQRNAAL